MPIYCYYCPECGERSERSKLMSQSAEPESCLSCSARMVRDHSAEHVNSGNKEYGKTKWSDSLAVSPDQIQEHKRTFPDIRVDDQGRPGFDNFRQHNSYLEKTGFVKAPQKIRKKGKRIA